MFITSFSCIRLPFSSVKMQNLLNEKTLEGSNPKALLTLTASLGLIDCQLDCHLEYFYLKLLVKLLISYYDFLCNNYYYRLNISMSFFCFAINILDLCTCNEEVSTHLLISRNSAKFSFLTIVFIKIQ